MKRNSRSIKGRALYEATLVNLMNQWIALIHNSDSKAGIEIAVLGKDKDGFNIITTKPAAAMREIFGTYRVYCLDRDALDKWIANPYMTFFTRLNIENRTKVLPLFS